ncbi:DNA-binding response regulator [Striga asiatica]|uniref:DNA-binding response regulator n=1 Tax=Striga asiatica TaxID=4170 RepID=A0A5A7Q2S6_STRAF|nr:DNA-binding response regulator [Striga asiatica]
MESAFPDSDAVERRLVVKGTDDLGLDGFAPGEHHLSIVKLVIRSCRPVISSRVKHPPLHRSRSRRCIDGVRSGLLPLPERGISKQAGEPHLFQFQRLSPIEVESNGHRFLPGIGFLLGL